MGSLSFLHIVSILATVGGTVLPQLLPMVPKPYADAISAVVAAVGAIFHLYLPSPSAPAAPVATK